MEQYWNNNDGKITEPLLANPIAVPVCPPKMLYKLAGNRTSVLALRNQRLTA